MDQILSFILGGANGVLNILILISVLGLLIFIHELGHFLAARKVGARVEEFSIGFGPKIWSKKRGETEYMLKAFPLGGYVKISGEEELFDDETNLAKAKKDPKSLLSKSVKERLLVMVAGVTMNYILAIILFYIILSISGFSFILSSNLETFKPYGATVSEVKYDNFIYKAVQEESKAQEVGMPETGLVKSINGKTDFLSKEFHEIIKDSKGKEVVLEVCNVDGKECNLFKPVIGDDGILGVSYIPNYYVQAKYEGLSIVFSGFIHSVNELRMIFFYMDGMFDTAQSTGDYKEVALTGVSSPVAMYFAIDSFKEMGPIAILALLANFSFTLAIMNILPIPALDGGRILILVIEAIRRKPLPRKLELTIIQVSFYILLGIMALVVLKDLVFIKDISMMF